MALTGTGKPAAERAVETATINRKIACTAVTKKTADAVNLVQAMAADVVEATKFVEAAKAVEAAESGRRLGAADARNIYREPAMP